MTAPTPAWVIAALRRAGDDALPALPGGSPVRWLHTRGALAQAPMLGARRLYLAPADGFGYGQYLLARTVHAGPVSAQVRVSGAAVIVTSVCLRSSLPSRNLASPPSLSASASIWSYCCVRL